MASPALCLKGEMQIIRAKYRSHISSPDNFVRIKEKTGCSDGWSDMSEADRPKYQVYVDNNFRYLDESERYLAGSYMDCETALKKCVEIVENSLSNEHKPGMSEKELVDRYKSFGEDPWISSPHEGCRFSAWKYVERRAKEICSNAERQKANER
jgi:hypothetical protein